MTHGKHKTPHVAMIAGSLVGARRHARRLVRRAAPERGGAIIGGTLLNMAVFGAMFSYILQAVSFILLRRNLPNIERPYRSPLGILGAVGDDRHRRGHDLLPALDPIYRKGVIAVAIWFVVGIVYFALVGRHR